MKHIKLFENFDWSDEDFNEEEFSKDDLNFISSKSVKLNCGIECDYWKRKNKHESLRISMYDLYQGYGKYNNLKLISELFNELNQKGFTGNGISFERGYYDSINNLFLDVSRDIF